MVFRIVSTGSRCFSPQQRHVNSSACIFYNPHTFVVFSDAVGDPRAISFANGIQGIDVFDRLIR